MEITLVNAHAQMAGNQKTAEDQKSTASRGVAWEYEAEKGQNTVGKQKKAGQSNLASGSKTAAGQNNTAARKSPANSRSVNLLVDIQAKLQAGKGI